MEGTETIEFVGGSKASLVGVLHHPDTSDGSPVRGSVLLAHCFTCSKDIHTMTRLARSLTEAGFATFRFDFTGRGESGGDFAEKTLSANVVDVVRAATTLIQRGFGPCGLVGHSFGGTAVLLAARRLRPVRSIVTVSSPSDPTHVRHLFGGRDEEILERGRGEVVIGGRTFELEAGFLRDLVEHDVLAAVEALNRPYMVAHCEGDTVVPVSEGERLFAAAHDPKRFARYPDGDHLFADRTLADRLAGDIVSWFRETL